MTIQRELESIKKGEIEPVYLVQGMEEYLNTKVKNAFFHSVLSAEEAEFNFGKFDMESILLDNALEEALSAPFFGEKKLIFIENAYFLTAEKPKNELEHDLKWLEEYIADPNPESVVVLFAPYAKLDQRKGLVKKVVKKIKMISTAELGERETQQYAKEVIKNEGYTIESDAFGLLMHLTGSRLSAVLNELDKFMLYALEDKKITKKMVSELTAKSLEENVFELTNLVLKKQSGETLLLFQALINQKEEPIKIVALLLSQFRLLLQVKILRSKGYQQGDIAKVLKVHPYRVKLAMQQEKILPHAELSFAYKTLIDTDYNLKSGHGDPLTQFELFVLSFSAPKANKRILC